MIVCNDESCERADAEFRKRALRDAVICIGWLKLISILCYLILYFLVHSNSKGHFSNVLQIMILATILPTIVHGVLLFFGSLEEKLVALELSLWLCLVMAAYNTILGIMGGIYFIRTGFKTMHFLLAVSFAIMALNIFTVICHDILIVYSYKQILACANSARSTTSLAK